MQVSLEPQQQQPTESQKNDELNGDGDEQKTTAAGVINEVASAVATNTEGESTNNNNRAVVGTPSKKMANENNADAMNTMMGAPPRASGATTIGSNGTQNLSQAINSNNHHSNNNSNSNQNNFVKNTESDDDDYGDGDGILGGGIGGGGGGGGASGVGHTTYGGYWGPVRATNRAISPSMMDNLSENSSQPPMPTSLVRSKSRPELVSGAGAMSRYGNLSYWKARRVLFYRNGDPFFPGVEYRFKPFRDIGTLESLLDKISPKMDLPRGARYVFSMDGDRKYNLDELEDGASYVVSSFKAFKVSCKYF